MPTTLYDAVIPPFQRMLGSLRTLLDKAAQHCSQEGIAPGDLIESRLAPDMLPFAYQIKSTAVHSAGAIDGVQRGVFSPDRTPPGQTFDELAVRLDSALQFLDSTKPAEINGFDGKPMRFEFSDYYSDYTGDSFLLHFSKPNFYFHATTAYDILRHNGLAIGKGDYIGRIDLRKA